MPVLIEAHISGDLATVLPGYDQTVAPIDESRLLHICAPADDGFTVIEVWESEDALKRFLEVELPPIWESVGMADRMSAPPRVTIRQIHHVAIYRQPLDRSAATP
jgi:hypothetical protein